MLINQLVLFAVHFLDINSDQTVVFFISKELKELQLLIHPYNQYSSYFTSTLVIQHLWILSKSDK